MSVWLVQVDDYEPYVEGVYCSLEAAKKALLNLGKYAEDKYFISEWSVGDEISASAEIQEHIKVKKAE